MLWLILFWALIILFINSGWDECFVSYRGKDSHAVAQRAKLRADLVFMLNVILVGLVIYWGIKNVYYGCEVSNNTPPFRSSSRSSPSSSIYTSKGIPAKVLGELYGKPTPTL